MEAKELIEELGIYLKPTGSRVICPTACDPATDWDFIGVVEDLTATADRLLKNGWGSGTSLKVNEAGDVVPVKTNFVSLKRKDANLILTNSADWEGKFMLATRTATKLGLTHKAHRIALFQAMLYGNG